MKKIIYSAIIVMAFGSVSIANTKEKKSNITQTISVLKTEKINDDLLEENKVVSNVSKNTETTILYTDFAGFVCWLMGGHCQPVETK